MSKWKNVALKYIGEIVTGNTPSTKINDYYNSNDIPFYKPNDISNTEVSKLNIATSYISETARSCARIIPCNSILVTCIGIIGKTAITTNECSCNQQINAIIPYKDLANSLYLAYAIMSKKTYMQDTANAPIVPIINKTKFASIEIPLPPLEEQHKIASILDTVSEVLKLRKQQLNELDLLVKSKFEEMFGNPIENPMKWEHITLNDICDIGSSKRIYESEYVSNGIPFYRTKEIVELSKGNSISTELFISIERFNEIKSKYSVPKKNDILISAVGTIGTIWVVDGKEDFYFKDGNLLLIKASNKFSPIYMSFLLENLIGYYKQGLSSGTAYCALTIEKLKCMKAFNPPIELQNKFAFFVEHVDELKSEVQKSIDQLQTLFDSLMQQYFE